MMEGLPLGWRMEELIRELVRGQAQPASLKELRLCQHPIHSGENYIQRILDNQGLDVYN
jgi:hypothetical protein